MAIDLALFGNLALFGYGRVLYAPTTHIVCDHSLRLFECVGRIKSGCVED